MVVKTAVLVVLQVSVVAPLEIVEVAYQTRVVGPELMPVTEVATQNSHSSQFLQQIKGQK